MDILVLGRGGRAKAVINAVHDAGAHRVVGLVGDGAAEGEPVLGVPWSGGMDELAAVVQRTGVRHAVIAHADNGARMRTMHRSKELVPDLQFISIIHPRAILGQGVACGPGTVIMAGACIGPDTMIAEHSAIDANVTIGADCTLGNFTSIGAGATIGDGCQVGGGTAVGMQAGLVQGIIVGTHCVIGPGAMVVESVPDLHVAVGTPARCTRTRLVGEPYQ